MTQACEFCIRERFVERIFDETKLFYCILGRSPIRPGHTIVIPKRHINAFEELSQDELTELMLIVKRWVPKLLKAFTAVGYNMVVNVSPAAGQTVPHLHVHIIPRTADEQGKVDEVRRSYYRSRPEDERVRLTMEEAAEQVTRLRTL